jgi:hypothetical protein
MVGVYMDGDEAASGSVQYPLDPFVITSAWEPKLYSCNRYSWEIKSWQIGFCTDSQWLVQTSLKSTLRYFMRVAIFMKYYANCILRRIQACCAVKLQCSGEL